ncbi:TPA: hypothetical protein NIF12_006941 [Pseudomonas aeruginosa]|nr:hypothetical protein [Pseudomonas aeruginosa]HCF4734952.1 hypothetical protein [Pseudomonas aeruginosa]
MQAAADGCLTQKRWTSSFYAGKKLGVFRIDIGAPALTEIFSSLIFGLVDAERRGRIARAGMAALIEQFFLNGACNYQT